MEKDKFSECYNHLKRELIDGRELDSRVEGYTIIGSETLSDGVVIFLQSPAGALFALEISADDGESYTPLEYSLADITELYTIYAEEHNTHEEHNYSN